jgi:hydrogenase nickel incorporation protein HypB
MCSTCGCGQPEDEVKILVPGENNSVDNDHQEEQHAHHHHHAHDHDHSHAHGHSHTHDHHHGTQIDLERSILQENDLLAQRNRGYLEAKDVYAINMVSSPGSGKNHLAGGIHQNHEG